MGITTTRTLVRASVATTAILLTGLLSACGGASPGSDSNLGPNVDKEVRAAFPAKIRDSGMLRVVLSAPAPPMATLDGDKLGGIDIDLYHKIGELAGLKVEFTNVKFDAIMPSLQAGKADATGTVLPSPDRRAIADFAVFFKVPFGVLVPKNNPYHVKGVADLCGHTVALVQGSTPPQAIVADRQKECAQKGQPEIKTRLYSDNSSPLLAVKSGDAYAFVQSEALTTYIAKTADNGSTFVSVPDLQGLGGTVYFTDAYGVLKSNQDLLKALQKALQKLVDNGEYGKVLQKYGVENDAVTTISINDLAPADRGK